MRAAEGALIHRLLKLRISPILWYRSIWAASQGGQDRETAHKGRRTDLYLTRSSSLPKSGKACEYIPGMTCMKPWLGRSDLLQELGRRDKPMI